MAHVKDILWKKGISAKELVDSFGNVGFQSVKLNNASKVIVKMKKEGATIFLTFSSNMVTSGLRGLFAQTIKLGLTNVIVTTVGGIEEDIMKAMGEKFDIGKFSADDIELYEKGENRVGNLFIKNESYCKFEDFMQQILSKLYKKQKSWPVSDLLKEIGLTLKDENSILYQAAKNDVKIFCPAITDGSFGFHLYMFKQKNPDFIVDVVEDFKNILLSTSNDEKKGVIALGGGVSKHHALLSCLLNGGLDYAVYLTTSHQSSGSMGGATTDEAKSWGKVKDDSDASTVIGDVTITFPLVIIGAFEELIKEGIIK
jgi:deoxyhypusine synthase